MRYFVTGGTGFIGKRLIRKLLASKDGTVWFLLREESRAKLPALLAFWGVDDARAIPVLGDALRPGLGVSEADRGALSGKLDHFFTWPRSTTCAPAPPNRWRPTSTARARR